MTDPARAPLAPDPGVSPAHRAIAAALAGALDDMAIARALHTHGPAKAPTLAARAGVERLAIEHLAAHGVLERLGAWRGGTKLALSPKHAIEHVHNADGSRHSLRYRRRCALHHTGGAASLSATNEANDTPWWEMRWMRRGTAHRSAGPAIVIAWASGQWSEQWWSDGERHRIGGPAIRASAGTEQWFVRNARHRDGGPAIIAGDGRTEWWRDGERHRDDGPAVVHSDGRALWYRDGKLHRAGGPAAVHRDGRGEFWHEGTQRSGPLESAMREAHRAGAQSEQQR